RGLLPRRSAWACNPSFGPLGRMRAAGEPTTGHALRRGARLLRSHVRDLRAAHRAASRRNAGRGRVVLAIGFLHYAIWSNQSRIVAPIECCCQAKNARYLRFARMITPEDLMRMAIDKCREGVAAGQSPFGCAIAREGEVVAAAHNVVWMTQDITAHAE